jgi:hypothetical protein
MDILIPYGPQAAGYLQTNLDLTSVATYPQVSVIADHGRLGISFVNSRFAASKELQILVDFAGASYNRKSWMTGN